MYLPEPPNSDEQSDALSLLSAAIVAPEEICQSDPDTQIAFEESLRAMAEDIVLYHPGLAHILIGMSAEPESFIHGRN